MFKTSGKYGFDSLLLTDTNMKVLDGYIHHIRPLQKPVCDYVLVTRNGGQHNKIGELMSKLVFDSIGKYLHPTRYRQIVETASSNQLSPKEQVNFRGPETQLGCSKSALSKATIQRGRNKGPPMLG